MFSGRTRGGGTIIFTILTVFKFAIIACNQEYTWMRELIADIHHLLIVCLLYL